MKSKMIKIYEQGPVNVLKVEESEVNALSQDEVSIHEIKSK